MHIGSAGGHAIPVNSWSMTVIEETSVVEGRASEPPAMGIISIAVCEHPEMNSTSDLLGNRIYWCGVCHKKIIIPMSQASLNALNTQDAQANFAGMMAVAFGEMWGKRAAEGQI